MQGSHNGTAGAVQHLQAENERLQQVITQLQQALVQRGEPVAQAVIDTVNHWCDIVEQPGHPAWSIAVGLLEKWVAANDRARRATSGIVVARDLPRA